MARVFISHALEDEHAARAIADQLRSAGFQAWLDVEHLRHGTDFSKQIDQAISDAEAYVVILSQSSDPRRPWVSKEWEAIVQQSWERPGARVVPVLLDDVELPTFLKDRIPVNLQGGVETLDTRHFIQLLQQGEPAIEPESASKDVVERFEKLRGIIEASTDDPEVSRGVDFEIDNMKDDIEGHHFGQT